MEGFKFNAKYIQIKKAVVVCVGCSKPLCDDCRVIFDGKNICIECEEKLQSMLNENSKSDNIDEFVSELTNRANNGKKQLEKLIKDEGIDEELKKFIDDTNERISGFLNNFERKLNQKEDKKGYLICNKCAGYYELQVEESSEDFILKCNCGGILKLYNSLNDHSNNDIVGSFDLEDILLYDTEGAKRAHVAYLLGETKDPKYVDVLCEATKDDVLLLAGKNEYNCKDFDGFSAD